MAYDISQKAMLASLHIKQRCARKYDKAVSKEVNDKYGSAEASGRYNKMLATREALKNIQAAVSAARTFHLEQTLPWGEKGERLLPSRNYMAYTRKMRRLKQDFESAVTRFVANYPAVIQEAKKELSGLFNPEDYPEAEELEKKFDFRTEITPIPTSYDFRVNLAEDEIGQIKQDLEKKIVDAQTEATKELWKRMYEAVERMVNRLSDPDAVFRDSLVGNIVKLTELLPRLNLNNDPDLEAMRQSIEYKLCAYTPKELRKDKAARRETAKAAQTVLEVMSGYMEAA